MISPSAEQIRERLRRLAVAKSGLVDTLRSIPDNRPYEDGSRLSLGIQIENLAGEVNLLEEAADLLASQSRALEEAQRELARYAPELRPKDCGCVMRKEVTVWWVNDKTCAWCDAHRNER